MTWFHEHLHHKLACLLHSDNRMHHIATASVPNSGCQFFQDNQKRPPVNQNKWCRTLPGGQPKICSQNSPLQCMDNQKLWWTTRITFQGGEKMHHTLALIYICNNNYKSTTQDRYAREKIRDTPALPVRGIEPRPYSHTDCTVHRKESLYNAKNIIHSGVFLPTQPSQNKNGIST